MSYGFTSDRVYDTSSYEYHGRVYSTRTGIDTTVLYGSDTRERCVQNMEGDQSSDNNALDARIKSALSANMWLQAACRAQLTVIQRALVVNERSRGALTTGAAVAVESGAEAHRRQQCHAAAAPTRPSIDRASLAFELSSLTGEQIGAAREPFSMEGMGARGELELLRAPSPSLAAGDTPSPTADALRRRALGCAVQVRPPRGRETAVWQAKEREQLRDGVVAMLLSTATQSIYSRIAGRSPSEFSGALAAGSSCSRSSQRSSALSSGERGELEGRLRWLHAVGESVSIERAPDETVRRLLELGHNINWATLQAVHLPHRSALECKAQWTQRDDPQLRPFVTAARCDAQSNALDSRAGHTANAGLPGDTRLPERCQDVAFTDAEREVLRNAVERHGKHDWERVAAELTAGGFPGRTAMGCHRCFRAVIEPSLASAIVTGPDSQGPQFWTLEEDQALRVAVVATGNCNNWAAVARRVPGRTRKACLLRWVHVADPVLRKGRWTPAEDRKLVALVAQHGATNWPQWAPIEMGGRSSASCRERWFNQLNPAVNHGLWTPEDDVALRAAVALLGTSKWGQISMQSGLAGRTRKDCRERWIKLAGTRSTVPADGALVEHAAATRSIPDAGPDGEVVDPTSRHEIAPAVDGEEAVALVTNSERASACHEPMLRRMLGLAAVREGWNLVPRASGRGYKYVAPTGQVFKSAAHARVAASQLRSTAAGPSPLQSSSNIPQGEATANSELSRIGDKQPLKRFSVRWLVHRALCAGHTTHFAVVQYCRVRRPIDASHVDKHIPRVIKDEDKNLSPLWECIPTEDARSSSVYTLTAAGEAKRPSEQAAAAEDDELRIRQGVSQWPAIVADSAAVAAPRALKRKDCSTEDEALAPRRLRARAGGAKEAGTHSHPTAGAGPKGAESRPRKSTRQPDAIELGDLGSSARFPNEAHLRQLAADIGANSGRSAKRRTSHSAGLQKP